jgi:hypothetical protein
LILEFNIFTELLGIKSFSGAVSEPFALLCFGIALFALTAGLRVLFKKKDKNAERFFQELGESVAVRES